MTLHTRKTWQVPLRHNSYQAARKRIGELREEKVSRKRVMICKKGCSQKRKYKWVFLKGVYRAGGICVGSAWRFEVKRGNRVSRFVCHYVQGCGLKPDFPSQPAWLLRVLSLCFPVVPERQNRAIMTRCLKSLLGSLGRRWLIHI